MRSTRLLLSVACLVAATHLARLPMLPEGIAAPQIGGGEIPPPQSPLGRSAGPDERGAARFGPNKPGQASFPPPPG